MRPVVTLPDRATALLDFWFGPPDDPGREQHRKIWFRSNVEFDAALRQEFLGDYEAAAAGRLFFYMPFHHSEDLADQRRSLALSKALPRNPDRGGSLRRYGRPYIEVIERFGRFPHRNEILGRRSTAAEIAFLAERNSPS